MPNSTGSSPLGNAVLSALRTFFVIDVQREKKLLREAITVKQAFTHLKTSAKENSFCDYFRLGRAHIVRTFIVLYLHKIAFPLLST